MYSYELHFERPSFLGCAAPCVAPRWLQHGQGRNGPSLADTWHSLVLVTTQYQLSRYGTVPHACRFGRSVRTVGDGWVTGNGSVGQAVGPQGSKRCMQVTSAFLPSPLTLCTQRFTLNTCTAPRRAPCNQVTGTCKRTVPDPKPCRNRGHGRSPSSQLSIARTTMHPRVSPPQTMLNYGTQGIGGAGKLTC